MLVALKCMMLCFIKVAQLRKASLLFGVVLWIQAAASHAQTFEHIPIAMHAESNFVLIEGPIEEGAAQRFKEYMSEQSDVFRLRMNSPGGNVQEALKLGRLIRELSLNTEVGGLRYEINVNGYKQPFPGEGQCLSACALAFLGGVVREEASATSIGLHQLSDQISSSLFSRLTQDETRSVAYSMAQSVVGEVVAYMMEMGVDARVFTVLSQAQGSNSFEYLTLEQALEFDVVTPSGFGEWKLEPHNQGILSFSARQSVTRLYDTIFQVTSYCKANGGNFLLFTSTFSSQAEGRVDSDRFPFFTIAKYGDSEKAEATFNFDRESNNYKAWYKNENLYFEVRLTDSVLPELITPGRLFAISQNSRADGQYFWDHVLSDEDVLVILASYKLCAF